MSEQQTAPLIRLCDMSSANDVADAARVIRESFTTVARDFALTRDNCPTHASFQTDDGLRERFIRPGAQAYLLLLRGRAVGFVGLLPDKDQALELTRLAVLPNHRADGLGSLLVQYALTTARLQDARAVTIGIIAENERLIAWYRARGFVETERKRFPNLPFGVCYMKYLYK